MKLLQTDPRLLPEINTYGCFFMDCLALPLIHNNSNDFDTDKVNTAWKRAIFKDWLIPCDGFYLVIKPVEIINDAFDMLADTITGVINVRVDNSDGKNWIPGWYDGHDFCFMTNTSGKGVHYRLYDNHNTLVYDSYPGLHLGSWQQKSFYKVVKRC